MASPRAIGLSLSYATSERAALRACTYAGDKHFRRVTLVWKSEQVRRHFDVVTEMAFHQVTAMGIVGSERVAVTLVFIPNTGAQVTIRLLDPK